MHDGSGLRVEICEVPYRLVGASHEQLLHVMRLLGPHRGGCTYGGFTAWRIDWRYEHRPAGEGWTAGNARVELKIERTLPEWRPPRSAPSTLVLAWNHYLRALGAHEDGHVSIARGAGAALVNALCALRPCTDRTLVDAEVQALTNAVLFDARASEAAYDEATAHGHAQGATFWRP